MIERLSNNNPETANEIHSLFQESYKVEAALLGATDFPPLKRPIKDYVKTRNEFFGFKKNGELAGIIEISDRRNYTDISKGMSPLPSKYSHQLFSIPSKNHLVQIKSFYLSSLQGEHC